MVHEMSRPGVGYAGNDACPEGSLCAIITRPILSEKGLPLYVKTGSMGKNDTSSAG